jgi:predicted RNA-binding protein YlxR (DUF448 family)
MTKAPKSSLVRVTRTEDGGIAVDPTGSAHGRGAYVHVSEACVRAALGPRGVERALRAKVGPGEARKLTELVEGKQGNA